MKPQARHVSWRLIMSHRFSSHALTVIAVANCFTLAACQSTQSSPPQAPISAAPSSLSYTPPTFHMPTGTGCQGDIDRWQAIQSNDLQLGHVDPRIYNQIQNEIKAAQAECTQGHDAKASAMVASSKHQHGYPN